MYNWEHYWSNFTLSIKSIPKLLWFLLSFVMWLVKKTRVIFSSNQIQNQNQSQLGHSRFLAFQGWKEDLPRRNTKNKVQATHLKWKVFKLLLHLSQMTDSQHCFVPKVHVKNLRTRVKANRCWVSACSSTLNTTSLINNYSPKRRWPGVDICRVEKREDKCSPPAIDTEVNSWFNVHLVCRSNIFDSL